MTACACALLTAACGAKMTVIRLNSKVPLAVVAVALGGLALGRISRRPAGDAR